MRACVAARPAHALRPIWRRQVSPSGSATQGDSPGFGPIRPRPCCSRASRSRRWPWGRRRAGWPMRSVILGCAPRLGRRWPTPAASEATFPPVHRDLAQKRSTCSPVTSRGSDSARRSPRPSTLAGWPPSAWRELGGLRRRPSVLGAEALEIANSTKRLANLGAAYWGQGQLFRERRPLGGDSAAREGVCTLSVGRTADLVSARHLDTWPRLLADGAHCRGTGAPPRGGGAG